MKTTQLFKLSALTMALGMVVSGGAIAADFADQTVGYGVAAINEISVSGNVSALTIDSADAGSEPSPASDATTTYAITTNGSNKKITAEIDTAMPANVTLSLSAASASGLSAGEQTLSDSPADVVTGLSGVAESGQMLTYGLSATIAAVVGSDSKTVTLTIADGG